MFRKDSLIKNISVLVTGTVIAQAIPIALQPILKRLFTPEDFGVFEIYLKTLGILFVVFALKYDMAIVLPKNKIKALLILSLSISFAALFTILSYLILLIFDTEIMLLLRFPIKYKIALYLLPLSTLFFSIFNTFNYLLIREKKFKASSINKINRRASEGVGQITLAYIPLLKHLGLFIGNLLGNIIYSLSAYYQSFKGFKFDKRFFKPSTLIKIFKEYSDLPKYNIIPELLNASFFAALSFLVLSKFDIKEVGYMELTQRILAVPTAFIAYSVGQVLLQKTSEMVNKKQKITPEIRKVFFLLLLIALPFVLIILFFSTPIFNFVFGKEWITSGIYAKYLVVFYAMGFLISPLSQTLISLQKFKINAIWKIGRFILIIPIFLISFDNIDSYLISYSFLGIFSYVIYFIIIFYHSNKFDKTLQ